MVKQKFRWRLFFLLLLVVALNQAYAESNATNQTGSLYVISTPAAASLYVDNILKGYTPITVTNLTAGTHPVKLTKAGYNDYSRVKSIYAGVTEVLNVTLTPVQNQTNQTNKTGNLNVTSYPLGANLYVDNLYKGTTPLTVTNLTTGIHTVNVTRSNYYDYTAIVFISTGQTTSLHAKLLRKTGNLSVASNPAGANLYVDNHYKGITPITVKGLSEGIHAVKVTKYGYYDYTTTQYIYANKTAALNVTLTFAQNQTNATATLSVASNPTGANLYLDNFFKGYTPLTLTGLSVGNHTVKVAKGGYYNYTKTIYFSAGQTTTLNPTLTPVQNTTNQTTGNLYVTSTPNGALLYVDNVFEGLTPITVPFLSAGYHPVKVIAGGYKNYTRTIKIYKGQTTKLNATLTKMS